MSLSNLSEIFHIPNYFKCTQLQSLVKKNYQSKDKDYKFSSQKPEEYETPKWILKGYRLCTRRNKSFGGSIIIAKSGNEIVGIVVLNKTRWLAISRKTFSLYCHFFPA